MLVTFAVAAAIPAVMAALAIAALPEMPFWWEHDAFWVAVLFTPVVAVFAASGIIVAALADHWTIEVMSSGAGRHWANGAAYGLAAFAIMAAGFTDLGLGPLRAPRVLLTQYVALIEPSMERGVRKTLRRKLANLAVVPLCQLSLELHKDRADRLKVRSRSRELRHLTTRQRVALRKGVGDRPDRYREVLDARTDLRRYCLRVIVDDRVVGVVFPEDVPEK